jgi:hypothetical protein
MDKLFSGQARLPESRMETTIGAMPIGASGYTVPWAMWPDMDGKLWINGHYPIDRVPGGTVSMLVTRHEHGYEVDISEGHAAEFRWCPGSADSFVGGADALPVVSVKGGG